MAVAVAGGAGIDGDQCPSQSRFGLGLPQQFGYQPLHFRVRSKLSVITVKLAAEEVKKVIDINIHIITIFLLLPSPPLHQNPTQNMPILGVKEPGPSNPPHFDLERIIRPNILSLAPYRCARDDYDSGILLDANENALGPALPALSKLNGPASKQNGLVDVPADSILNLSRDQLATLNRYPSPTHDDLRTLIAQLRGVPSENWVFLGVGSDEVIDLLFRVSCIPAKDVVITTPPTYGMYTVTANVNDVGVVEVPLVTEDGRFQVDEPAVSCGDIFFFSSYSDS